MRSAGRIALLGLVCVLVASCNDGGSGSDGNDGRDRDILRRWLLCEECGHGELDSVRAASRRDRMVPLLDRALRGPPLRGRENMRRQLEETYQQLARRAASQGRTLPLTQDQYVSHFLGNYSANYQSRAIKGLVAIGTPAADSVLDEAADRVQSGASIYRGDVVQELTDATNPPRPPTHAWASISAGNLRTCAIASDGKSYCWGRNDMGQLGIGSLSWQKRPKLVAGNLPFTSISAGHSGWHTCGIAGQRAYCWGGNARGELGDGSNVNRPVPTPVAGGNMFVGVAVGGNHACAWTPAARAFCWGDNQFGQLGDGSIISRQQPVQVASDLGVGSVGAGTFHTCADSLNRQLHCWGRNSEGQLATGSVADEPSPTQAAGPVRVKSITVGAFHGCVLAQAASGVAEDVGYCAGNNDDGRLGDGSTRWRSSLVPVIGGFRFVAISAGGKHTCGIVQGTRALRCWGDNQFGQLGDGSTVDRSAPVSVAGSLTFTSVSAGFQHTCAIATGGAAYCWGRNHVGELGDNSVIDRLTPTEIATP